MLLIAISPNAPETLRKFTRLCKVSSGLHAICFFPFQFSDRTAHLKGRYFVDDVSDPFETLKDVFFFLQVQFIEASWYPAPEGYF